MRGRRSPTTTGRYSETRFFGKRLGELLDDSPLSQTAAAKQIGTPRENLSAYIHGRSLPSIEETDDVLDRIVETLVRWKKDRPRVKRELRDLLHADLLAAWMQATGRSVKDVERYLAIVGR